MTSRPSPIAPGSSEVDGPNQLWVADLTYIAILGSFVYLAAIMDAWSRRIVRLRARQTDRCQVDARGAHDGDRGHRNPPPGCIHHLDSEYLRAPVPSG